MKGKIEQRNIRQALITLRQFLLQEREIIRDLLIRPLSCRQVLDEGKDVSDEHRREILCRCVGDQVLYVRDGGSINAIIYVERNKIERTRKVATTTRITFSFTAVLATLASTGMMSYFLDWRNRARNSKLNVVKGRNGRRELTC